MLVWWAFECVFFFSLKGQTFLYVVSLAQGKVLLWNSWIVSAIHLDRLTDLWILQKTGYLEICSCALSPVFWYKGKQLWLINFQIQIDASHASGVELPQPLYNANSLVYEICFFAWGSFILKRCCVRGGMLAFVGSPRILPLQLSLVLC